MERIVYGHKIVSGVHGVVHHLSQGRDGLVQRQIAALQGIGRQALERIVDKVRIDLGLKGL